MEKQIKGVKFLGVDIDFYCKIPHGSLNIGCLKLENQGREFILDTVQSNYTEINNATTVNVTLAVDEELTPDCKFDLKSSDLDDRRLKVNLWWEENVELSNGDFVEPDSITLFVRFINDDGSGCTKAIDVNLE